MRDNDERGGRKAVRTITRRGRSRRCSPPSSLGRSAFAGPEPQSGRSQNGRSGAWGPRILGPSDALGALRKGYLYVCPLHHFASAIPCDSTKRPPIQLTRASSVPSRCISPIDRPSQPVNMSALNLTIDWKAHRWAVAYCLVATIGACCYGYDVRHLLGGPSDSQMIANRTAATDAVLHRHPRNGGLRTGLRQQVF